MDKTLFPNLCKENGPEDKKHKNVAKCFWLFQRKMSTEFFWVKKEKPAPEESASTVSL